MTQDYNVSISMNQAAVVRTGLVFKQGDFGFNLKITVLDFDTSNTTPQIVFRKPMGAVESSTITKSGNVYTYAMRGTELDTPGKVFCDLKLKNSTTQRISTASFSFECVADTLDGLAEEASSYSDTIAQIAAGWDASFNALGDTVDGIITDISDDNNQVIKSKDLQSNISDTNGEVILSNDLANSIKYIGKEVPVNLQFEQGGYDGSGGTTSSSKRIRLPLGKANRIDKIYILNDNAIPMILGKKKNGTLFKIILSESSSTYKNIIVDSANGWNSPSGLYKNDYNFNMMINSGIIDETDEIALVIKKNDNADISPADAANLVKLVRFYGNQRKTQVEVKDVQNIDFEGNESSTIARIADISCNIGDRFLIIQAEGMVGVVNVVLGGVVKTINIPWVEVVADSTTLSLGFTRRDGGNVSRLTIRDELIIYKFNVHGNSKYNCIVAASDSSETMKAMADYVCDGTNDSWILTCAANCNITSSNSANILLTEGTFLIDKWLGYDTYFYYGIVIHKSVLVKENYTVSIEGMKREHISNPQKATRIIETQTAYNSKVTGRSYALVGGIRKAGYNYLGYIGFYLGLYVKNIAFSPYDNDKPIVCVDGVGLCQLGCEKVQAYVYDKGDPTFRPTAIDFNVNPPAQGVIGIRGVQGSNRGSGNYIKTCNIYGMYEGIALTGEHFIVEDCLQHHCYYGFTVGNYAVSPQMEHPNVFIGNSVEQCYRFALLNRYGASEASDTYNTVQTLIYIGGSTESQWTDNDNVAHPMLPVIEMVRGAYRGRFESDYMCNNPMFESDGSGRYIDVVNTVMKSRGSNGDMNYDSAMRFPGEQFWNSQRNCLCVWTGTEWVKADGSALS